MATDVNVELFGVDELRNAIKNLELDSPKMKRDLKMIMSAVIKKARTDMLKYSKNAVGSNDPRKAYLAVKSAVYKRIFGGNINIISRRRNNGKEYVGGSHSASRDRGTKTAQMQGYYGSDRGFILRWLNAGTDTRTAHTMNANTIKLKQRGVKGAWKNHTYKTRTYKTSTIGARGKINGGNWFGSNSTQVMETAASNLDAYISRAIYEVWGDTGIKAGIED